MFERIHETAARMERAQTLAEAERLALLLPETPSVRKRVILAMRVRRARRALLERPAVRRTPAALQRHPETSPIVRTDSANPAAGNSALVVAMDAAGPIAGAVTHRG